MIPFFTLIIPCHNSNCIEPLFDSLTRQGINKTDLEIIIVDDNSSDKSYQNIVNKYDFNVLYLETDLNLQVHCPGNTRRKGMEYISGKWLCFADHDDYFEDNSLKLIKEYIENTRDHDIYEIITNIIYRKTNGDIIWKNECDNSWLHGKWYNVDKFIKPYGINFKEDLFANEDCYFNCQCFNQLIELGKDFDYLDLCTYNWVANPKSLSNVSEGDEDRGYIFNNFGDFIFAITEPYWKNACETKDDRYIQHIISGLMFCYFYYEAADYYKDISKYQDIYLMIKTLVTRISHEIGLLDYDIVNYVYQDIAFYEKALNESFIFMGHYIPRTSFQDFIIGMHIDSDQIPTSFF